MATNYDYDRGFTDYVHNNLALKIIYERLGWKEQKPNSHLRENADQNDAVDYFFVDKNTLSLVTVQERFRESKFASYNDITIRYKREFNVHEERKDSEFFKLNADYMVYGIINSSKYQYNQADNFLKYVIVDAKILNELIRDGKIIVEENSNSRYCKWENGVIHCPVNNNPDRSSSFIPIDVGMLYRLNDKAIKLNNGYNI